MSTSPAFLRSEAWKCLRVQALELYQNQCACCGTQHPFLNVDHVIPRKLAPQLALDITNLQLLCPTCNKGKGNLDVVDFRSERDKQRAREYARLQTARVSV